MTCSDTSSSRLLTSAQRELLLDESFDMADRDWETKKSKRKFMNASLRYILTGNHSASGDVSAQISKRVHGVIVFLQRLVRLVCFASSSVPDVSFNFSD